VLQALYDAEVSKEVAVQSSRPALSGPLPLTVRFVVQTVTLGLGPRSLWCPDCQIPLNLLQPDENEPSRLLGTCESCSKWVFLVELEPDWSKALIIELPDGDSIRKELESSGAGE
jgi:hypothetical protein